MVKFHSLDKVVLFIKQNLVKRVHKTNTETVVQIKVEVNKMYRHVELDIDGVFKYMLLLKKKKYAAVSLARLPNGELVETQEIKGLDMVRRDWSQLAAEAGK